MKGLTKFFVLVAVATLALVAVSRSSAHSADAGYTTCATYVKYQIPVEFVKTRSLSCYTAETIAVQAWLSCDNRVGGAVPKACSVTIWLPLGVRQTKAWTFRCVFDTSFVSEATYGRVCVGYTPETTAIKVVKYVLIP